MSKNYMHDEFYRQALLIAWREYLRKNFAEADSIYDATQCGMSAADMAMFATLDANILYEYSNNLCSALDPEMQKMMEEFEAKRGIKNV